MLRQARGHRLKYKSSDRRLSTMRTTRRAGKGDRRKGHQSRIAARSSYPKHEVKKRRRSLGSG